MTEKTVSQLINDVSNELLNPQEAKWIISGALNLKPSELYLIEDNKVSDEVYQRITTLVQKRKSGQPLQYLLGYWQFFNFMIKTTPDALIPRFETEFVADIAGKTLSEKQNPVVLEIGTGTGVIAIYLAKLLQKNNITIVATDISEPALNLAIDNATSLKVADKIQFLLGDIYKPLTGILVKFDLIVSNPPYLSEQEFKNLPAEVKNFEPKIALVSEGDPLRFYKEILAGAKNYLAQKGTVVLELDENRSKDVLELALSLGFKAVVIKDLTDKDRVLVAHL